MSAAKSPARPASQAAPPSSPRLPSPPPLPELQLGPSSPSINAPGEIRLDTPALQDDGAARRVRPGTSAADMARGPPYVPLHQLESPFQLQEYLKSLYCELTSEDGSSTIKPITKDAAEQLATPPIQQDTNEPVDRNLWLYELCRFLVQRTNRVIVSFFADSPPCSSQTCPEMRASEWQYLCAVHEPPKSCCAIDYCCHTLDWAANVLTSSKHFPSRLSLGGDGGAGPSMRQLTNIFRRVYRIYAHAWFQHREAFWMLEQEEGLYKFFKTVSDYYSLIPEDNYTVPPDAEGDREDAIGTPVSAGPSDVTIVRNDTQIHLSQHQTQHQEQPPPPPPPRPAPREPEPSAPSTPPTSTTATRRHRHTPSTGTQVAAIAEGLEEEEEDGETGAASSQSKPHTHAQLPTPISQGLPSESTANATNQSATSTASPPNASVQPRSPRPEMSIPILGPKPEDIRAPADPTPTPETHAADPFESSISRGRETVNEAVEEPPTPLTALDPNQQQQHSPLPSQLPTPVVQTTTQGAVKNEDDEVKSPGGGSIRTVGEDILSGILAHVDAKEEDPARAVTTGQRAETEVKQEDEDDEEMGEIKLGRSEGVNVKKEKDQGPDENKQATVEKEGENDDDVHKEQEEEKQAEHAENIKTEETPSGAV